ncbi:TetR/AcrR family transcriptional regulator [Nocardia fluminea]|uniref:TetR/AcrR family transcriptional regulator n=1 Tax=Nocardia fluminea TaxID=134984 RepID=UPI003662086C
MTALQRDKARTRKALLDAAERVLMTTGPRMSLDAVAKEAEVSKGGLLHHFPSRDALLVGLAEDWMQRFDRAVQRHLDDDDRPGRWCRAHIRASLEISSSGESWINGAVHPALLSIPGVLERVRHYVDRWTTEMHSDGLHPHRVLLISRALDGDALNELLSGAATYAECRNELRDVLLELSAHNGPLVADTGDTGPGHSANDRRS